MSAEDARAIERLLFAYADAVDAGDLAAVGELFREGRICGETPDGPVTLAEGSAAVEAFYRSLVRLYDDGTPRTRHVTTNVVVETDPGGEAASAASTYTVFQATDALPLQAIIVGRYADTFRRADGAWRFESRTMRADLTGDLSQHLLR
ncbi:3-phenylpropionate/cinnamic acid dioxygenase small subunit [Nocardioides aromaticivorans]|uniref:3-phenylpropionate/cinnamic acid dioxygenase small subunit n=1 Tax=Nocardioides aromaticivorans TaxID=200618 RepID=A0A7Z0CQ51_9ACTN|nr:nuclear transport factor 2 family protein [Nocardioides aromaticivorans]NYI46472.1 3-phenylpropionate/cinnamic acid dioxygenase small subunit [Nocardioides aromaticivorans]